MYHTGSAWSQALRYAGSNLSAVYRPFADILKTPQSGTIRRSILTLDKSEEPFETQITQICDILGIQLQTHDHDSTNQEESHSYGPQEEWALRWLLKKLQSDDIHPGRQGASTRRLDTILNGSSPCLNFRAWLLLRALLLLTPLTKVASLLNTFKFTLIVKNSILWLQQKIDQENDLHFQESDDALATVESSSATLEPSPVKAPHRSRKRKRDDTSISLNWILPVVDPDVKRLFGSICCTMREVDALMNDMPDQSRGFAVEYMKAALKSSAESAAAILGGSFSITNFLLRRSCEPLVDSYDTCINPMLTLWNLRFQAKDDPSGYSDLVCEPNRIGDMLLLMRSGSVHSPCSLWCLSCNF